MKLSPASIQTAIELAKAYGATRLVLFGSYLNTPDQARDLDLAVDGVSGWKLYELAARLEETLHVPLDLVPLHPATPLTQQIESHGRVLYAT
jgi:predicted nucleotidyltransferase